MSRENQGLLLGAIGVFAFALTLPATRYLVAYLDPVFIGLGRSFFASIVAAGILILFRQPWPSKRQCLLLLIVTAGVVIGFPVLSAIAMRTLPAAHGGVVLAVLPIATAAMSVLLNNERPSLGFWVTGVIGAVLVVLYSLLYGSQNELALSLEFADFVLLLAVVSAAAGYAVGGKLASEMQGWQVICWALVLGMPFLALPTLVLINPVTHVDASLLDIGILQFLMQLPEPALLSFAYLTLISQLIGFFFWYKGLAIGGVARVSQLQLLQPFITIVASAWLLSEVINPATTWFAIAVVIVVAISKRMTISKP